MKRAGTTTIVDWRHRQNCVPGPSDQKFVRNSDGHVVRVSGVPGVTMVRLTKRQRGALGGTLRELANYGAAALVFGQFVGDGVVSWSTLFAGTAFWFAVIWLGLLIEGEW